MVRVWRRRRQKYEMKNVAAGFSLRQHRRGACATNDLSLPACHGHHVQIGRMGTAHLYKAFNIAVRTNKRFPCLPGPELVE
jgi:hypothetical protein